MVKQNGTNLATPQEKAFIHPTCISSHTKKTESTMENRRK
jgi:hypothetical protein